MPKTSKKQLAYIMAWRKANPEKVREYQRRGNKKYYAKNKEKEKARRDSPEHKQYIRDWKDRYFSIPSNRIRIALEQVQRRAIKNNMSFSKALFKIAENPPTHCTCCNQELNYVDRKRSRLSRSPSFDRINNTKGYTFKNVAVICCRCNYLKNDASLAELKLLLTYVERELVARN